MKQTINEVMKKNDENSRLDPEQLKWDNAGPREATGRRGGAGGDYNEGPKDPEQARATIEQERTGQGGMDFRPGASGVGTEDPSTENERRYGGSHTAGTTVKNPEDSEWKGGTPEQGPTSGGMGSAGGGHDTDETGVWEKE